MFTIPEGWTDDMRIAIAPGAPSEELVDLVFESLLKFGDATVVCQELRARFGLSEEDARLAIDRVPGGIIRAITGNPENRPDPVKDPLAHIAFERVWAELPRRHLFSRRKRPSGRWLKWFEDLRKIVKEKRQPPLTIISQGG